MLIVQCDDLDADRARLASIGVRTVWKADLPQIRGTHLHPKDTGGTLLSLDDATPPDSWHWAGPQWREHVRRRVVDSIVAAELQSEDPAALARRWSEILDRPSRYTGVDCCEIALEGSRLRFVPAADERGEGLAGFDVRAMDRESALAAARQRGFTVEGARIMVAGINVDLV
jgi:hypothetical protein